MNKVRLVDEQKLVECERKLIQREARIRELQTLVGVLNDELSNMSFLLSTIRKRNREISMLSLRKERVNYA